MAIEAKQTAGGVELTIYEDIGFFGVTAKAFAEALRPHKAAKSILVRLNSYGGEVFDGLAIYRQLADHGARVTISVDGIAASAASVIAMAGDEIVMAESSFMMIHAASGGVYGPASYMREMADTLDKVTGQLADIYVARSGQSRAAVDKWLSTDTWFTASEAKESGLATSISTNKARPARATAQARQILSHCEHAPDAILQDVTVSRLYGRLLRLKRH